MDNSKNSNSSGYGRRLILAPMLVLCWIWLLIMLIETIPDSEMQITHPAAETPEQIN